MKETFQNGLKTYSDLVQMKNFKRSELWLKGTLLPFALIIHSFLFIVAFVFYLIERLFSHFFKWFITVQATLLQKKASAPQAMRKFYTIGSVLAFIVFLPFILVYYLAMLFKYTAKHLMKNLVFALDFSDALSQENYLIFDDVDVTSGMQMSGMMKDLSQTQALGSAFEQIVTQRSKDQGRHRHDDIDQQ